MDYTILRNVTQTTTPSASSYPEEPAYPCGVFFFIIYGPLYGLVCTFGLVGNSLAFAVLHGYRSGANVGTYLLKALAMLDILFLVTAASIQMYMAMSLYFGLVTQLEYAYGALQTFAWPLAHSVQMLGVWMMVIVAGNRYVAVCKPLDAPRLCTKSRVQIEISAIVSGTVIFNIPRIFEYRYISVKTPVYSIVKSVNESDTFYGNGSSIPDHVTTITSWREETVNVGLTSMHIYNILYENVAYVLFVFLLPLLILVIFNFHLVKELRNSRKSLTAINKSSRKSKSCESRNSAMGVTRSRSADENNITLVMVIIIVAFIVCQLPATVNQILYYTIPNQNPLECTHYQRYFHISNLLITMNASTNFVIYCLFRRQFQRKLVALFCKADVKSSASNFSHTSTCMMNKDPATANRYLVNKRAAHPPQVGVVIRGGVVNGDRGTAYRKIADLGVSP